MFDQFINLFFDACHLSWKPAFHCEVGQHYWQPGPHSRNLMAQRFNPLNARLNPICHLLALEAHHILHIGTIRVNAVAVGKG
jgi:hypothetical protein